jgi:tight adherence protein C
VEILAFILIFISLMGVLTYAGYRYYAKPRGMYDQISASVDYLGEETPEQTPEKKSFLFGLVESVGDRVAARQKDTSGIRMQLVQAGYRNDSAVQIFYGSKVALAIVFFLAALIFDEHLPFAKSNPLLGVLMMTLLGYVMPAFILKKKVKARQKRLRLSLPDALDLMVVCVEAGLGLDQAMANVSQELRLTHPEIAQELNLVNLEMTAGTRRLDALRNLSDRTGVEDIRKLVAVLIQADRFGTSVGESLRTHSEYMRLKRRQTAEEQANKVAVKLVFPIFFFIMPAIVLVAAGPAMIRVFKTLLPMMRKMGA